MDRHMAGRTEITDVRKLPPCPTGQCPIRGRCPKGCVRRSVGNTVHADNLLLKLQFLAVRETGESLSSFFKQEVYAAEHPLPNLVFVRCREWCSYF